MIDLYKVPRQPEKIIDCDAINRICNNIFTMPGDLDNDKAEMLIDDLTYATEDETIIPALQEIKPMIQKGNYKTAAALANDIWLIYRRGGIGGSDAASIEGLSKWRTSLELYYDKIGDKANEEITPQRQYIFDFGHAMEAFVAEHFEKVFMDQFKSAIENSFSMHYGEDIRITQCRVYRDTYMYKSPENQFMRADLDFKIDLTLENGKVVTGIFECKTTSPFTVRDDWESTPPKYYECQTRHYMAVMDYPFTIIACAADNNANNYYAHVIFRNKKYEKKLISDERKFWEAVETKSPTYEMGVNNLNVLLDKSDNLSQNTLKDNSNTMLGYIKEYEDIQTSISDTKALVKELEKKLDIVKSNILTYMSINDVNELESQYGNYDYNIQVTEKISNLTDWNKFVKALITTMPDEKDTITDLKNNCKKNAKPKKSLKISCKEIKNKAA